MGVVFMSCLFWLASGTKTDLDFPAKLLGNFLHYLEYLQVRFTYNRGALSHCQEL